MPFDATTPEPSGPRHRRLIWLAVGLAALSTFVVAVTAPGYGVVAQVVVNGAFVAVGALVCLRRPGNAVGLLALAFGVLLEVQVALQQVALRLADGGSLDAAGSLAWVAAVEFPVAAALFVPMFLAFPDRNRPTRAGRWYLAVLALVVVVQTGLAALARPALVSDPDTVLPSPFVDATTADAFFDLAEASILLTVLLMLGTIPVLVRRWRRGGSIERRQIGWLGLAFALYTVVAGVNAAVQPDGGELFLLVDALGGAAMPAAFAVAILRYRLYDIDVIVSKTVQFLGLAGVIAAVYAAVVVGAIALVGGTGDGVGLGPPVVATAIVAVLFEPARARLQRWANRLVYGERATPYQVLSGLAATLADTRRPAGASELAALVAAGTGAEAAAVWLWDGTQLRPTGSHPAEAAREPWPRDADGLPRDDHHDWQPVHHRDDLYGAVSITKPADDPINRADRALLADVAAGTGLLLRNLRLDADLRARAEELRSSRRQLIQVEDDERRRLERNLHDGAQQQVVALKVKLGIARTLAERDGADAVVVLLDGLAADTQSAVDRLRAVAHGLHPPLLERHGLAVALDALDLPIPARVETGALGRYDGAVEQTAYVVVTEVMEQAHLAGATRADVTVVPDGHALVVTCAFDAIPAALNLGHIGDRVDAFDGTMTVDPQPDGRTTVTATLPVASPLAVGQ